MDLKIETNGLRLEAKLASTASPVLVDCLRAAFTRGAETSHKIATTKEGHADLIRDDLILHFGSGGAGIIDSLDVSVVPTGLVVQGV